MNTVDALNVLGKALCGDSFEVKPGLTDAETILEIAKNYSGGSSGSGLPEIVFQMDLTNASSASDRDNIGFAILTSKEEAKALGKRGSNCIVCLDIINPNNISLPGGLSSGRYNGYVCRMLYNSVSSKIQGQPDEEYLSLNPYCISQGNQAVTLPEVYLLDYDTTQHDVWTNRGDALSAFSTVLTQFGG